VRVDLHRHLEGSHSAEALAAVAEQFDVRDPTYFDAATGRFRSADALRAALTLTEPSDDAGHFYVRIQRARIAYVSEQAVAELARRAFVEAAAQTEGFEMRVSLFSMTRTLLDNEHVAWRELSPVAFAERARALLQVVLTARDAAVLTEGAPMLIRVGFSRTFESEPHYRAMAAMLVEHRAAICGLDVLGIVAGHDPEPMPPALREILRGLRAHIGDLTVHAGEFDDHRSVERTLALEPQAIGHGVRAVESDAMMARLAAEGITLEVCPSSNRWLIPTALAALEHRHGAVPLVALQRNHVHCVLGSDDPAPMATTFDREWAIAAESGVDMVKLAEDGARRWNQLPQPPCGPIIIVPA